MAGTSKERPYFNRATAVCVQIRSGGQHVSTRNRQLDHKGRREEPGRTRAGPSPGPSPGPARERENCPVTLV
jgi:hypothetical protein